MNANVIRLEIVGEAENGQSEVKHVKQGVEAPPCQPAASVAIAPEEGAKKGAWREKGAAMLKNILLPSLTFLLVGVLWAFVHSHVAHEIPSPAETWDRAREVLAHPFYENGPNDMGIGWQVSYSLGRVMAGFALAALVGIPVGFIMGSSESFSRAWQPLIQILRPVSPLAWLPIGLLLFKAVNPSAIFVIFITSIWPMIVNTAAGVKAIPRDYMNVAAVLRLGRFEVTRKILLPATLPHVLTGMRLSLNIAWMVIVAAEMLTGGIGIGFYVWDEWNNLNMPSIIVAIGIIGVVGIVLESGMNLIQRYFDYNRQ
ncbi:MAG TPA: nitrate ABC transporter permease [Sulfuricella sp.]|nr:nitrate ABC transporter permease [Sulfuricella sp.]